MVQLELQYDDECKEDEMKKGASQISRSARTIYIDKRPGTIHPLVHYVKCSSKEFKLEQ